MPIESASKIQQPPLGDLQSIVAHINSLSRHGNFDELRALAFGTLDDDIRATPYVAAALASHYASIGDFHLAAKIIDMVKVSHLLRQHGALMHEDIAWLALVSARCDIYRFGKFDEALQLVEMVEDIYFRLNCECRAYWSISET